MQYCQVCKNLLPVLKLKPHILTDVFNNYKQLNASPFLFIDQATSRNIPVSSDAWNWQVLVRKYKEPGKGTKDFALIIETRKELWPYEIWLLDYDMPPCVHLHIFKQIIHSVLKRV